MIFFKLAVFSHFALPVVSIQFHFNLTNTAIETNKAGWSHLKQVLGRLLQNGLQYIQTYLKGQS